MKVSKVTDYAVRVVVYMALLDKNTITTVKEIAQDTNMPPFFLSKVVQSLIKAGVIKAKRGRYGGLVLDDKAKDMCIEEIIEAVEGPTSLIKKKSPSGDSPQVYNAISAAWEEAHHELTKVLQKHTISSLAEKERSNANSFLSDPAVCLLPGYATEEIDKSDTAAKDLH